MKPLKSVLLTSGLVSSLAIAPTLATEGPDPTATPQPVSTPAAIAPAFTALSELTATDPTATLESAPASPAPRPNPATAIATTPIPIPTIVAPATMPLSPLTTTKLPLASSPSPATAAWAIAQADGDTASETTDESADFITEQTADPSPEPTAEPTDALTDPDADAPPASTSPRWQFSFEPYGLVPIGVNGDVTARGRTADVSVDLGDILESLDMAFFGRFEGWRGPVGFIFDTSYSSVSANSEVSLPLRNENRQLDIDTDVQAQFTRFDFGAGYRFGIKNPQAETEFGLGPVLIDVIAGLRVQNLQQELDLDADLNLRRNLDIQRDFEKRKTTTVVEPLLSSRIRWNLSEKLAAGLRGDISGFGIDGLTLTWAVQGGIDWMFSGNTSLLLGYRVGQLKYSTGSGDDEFGADLVSHGPYLGMRFRF